MGPGVGDQNPPKPETRNRKPETGNRKPETGNLRGVIRSHGHTVIRLFHKTTHVLLVASSGHASHPQVSRVPLRNFISYILLYDLQIRTSTRITSVVVLLISFCSVAICCSLVGDIFSTSEQPKEWRNLNCCLKNCGDWNQI